MFLLFNNAFFPFSVKSPLSRRRQKSATPEPSSLGKIKINAMYTMLFTVRKLKELCCGCWLHFVDNANKASLFPMKLEELLLNDKITALCQTNYYVPQVLLQMQLFNNENELWKTIRLTSFPNTQLQSVSILFKYVHACVLLYLFAVLLFLSLVFMVLCFTEFNGGSFLNCDKFCDTAPLKAEHTSSTSYDEIVIAQV